MVIFKTWKYSPIVENPSWLQATIASKVDQKSSQTVPHCSFQQISTRPSDSVGPLTSLMSPFSQTPRDGVQSAIVMGCSISTDMSSY